LGEASPNFFYYFKTHFIFPKKYFHWRFYYLDRQWKSISIDDFLSPTASENRFPMTVLSYPLVQIIISISSLH
jgi:hypothetical protein